MGPLSPLPNLEFPEEQSQPTNLLGGILLILSVVGALFLWAKFEFSEGRSYTFSFSYGFFVQLISGPCTQYLTFTRGQPIFPLLCPNFGLFILAIILIVSIFYEIGMCKRRPGRDENVGIFVIHFLIKLFAKHLLCAKHYSGNWGSNNEYAR